MSRRKTKINKSQKNQLDLYKDYEPDGRDLAEWLESSENTDPNYDPADHWASIETDIRIGK
tara:strand:+ start:332 stop:514 length:183 start_codon:yes stop_codon:yes gene_type:complete